MDQHRRQELEILYRRLSDEALINMIHAGAQEYQPEVFELLLGEAGARGIREGDGAIQLRIDPAPQEAAAAIEFIKVMEFRNSWEQAFVESLIKQTDIPYYIADEHAFRLTMPWIPRALMVDKSRLEEVRELLKDYEEGAASP